MLPNSQRGQTTWLKVNRDFGSIFSTLLPGTSAKLQPPEGETVMAGLEVRAEMEAEFTRAKSGFEWPVVFEEELEGGAWMHLKSLS